VQSLPVGEKSRKFRKENIRRRARRTKEKKVRSFSFIDKGDRREAVWCGGEAKVASGRVLMPHKRTLNARSIVGTPVQPHRARRWTWNQSNPKTPVKRVKKNLPCSTERNRIAHEFLSLYINSRQPVETLSIIYTAVVAIGKRGLDKGVQDP